MNCEEYLPLISGHLDGANSDFEERRLQEHLQACESCRELLSLMKQNDALLKSGAAVPPADLTDRIMREVRKEKQATSSTKKKRWIPIAVSGFAAAALLGLVVWGSVPLMSVFQGATSADSAKFDLEAPVEAVEEYANGMLSDAFEEGVPAMTDAPEAGVPEITDAPEANVPDTKEAPPETGVPAAADAPDDQDNTASYGSVPEFPTYGDAFAETTETSGRRSPTRYTASAPMLIVWNAGELDALTAYEPDALDEYVPLTANAVPSLFERHRAAIPLLRDLDPIAPDDGFEIRVYTVPYETMMAVFNECVGTYENAIYYPAAFTAPDECSIILVNPSE